MRTSTAFFAGAGTVIMVVAGGLGGGLMIANTMNPKAPAAQTKLERRAAEPSPSPSPSPGAAQAAVKDVPALAGQDGAKDGVKIQASSQSSAQAKTQSSAATATNVPAASEPGPAPSPSPQATQRDARDKPGAPDAAFAKAREPDLKAPDADTRRSAQKRQGRQHQQSVDHQPWVERRRMQRPPEADPRDVEQASRDDGEVRGTRDDNGVRSSYRDDYGVRSYSDDSGVRGYRAENRARVYPDDNPRRYRDGSGRDYAAEPVELELPRIRLFDGF